ncbi:Txe/YoeB family addiction module toxin [Lactiplantibacillus pentosus]|nr:Txe/YoeB family addiction module toxin [Lactiplantibacillus pentosus]
MTSVEFLGETWHEYIVWQIEDQRALNHINNLIKLIQIDGLGLGLRKLKPLFILDKLSNTADIK